MTVHDLTPVQEIAGMYFKRDDIFTPFGAGEVNGGKLHPQYEAKAMKYLVEHDLNTENALFWIVGAEPRER